VIMALLIGKRLPKLENKAF